MKVTKEQLRQIIKEELEAAAGLQEQENQEEQYFEILVREDGFADAELLSREEADELLNPETKFTRSYYSSGRYVAKVVRTAEPEGQ